MQNRIHKRFFLVTGLVSATVVIVALSIVLSTVNFFGTGDIIRFSIKESDQPSTLLGAGISLDWADSGNLLEDASFEPAVFRQSLTVIDGDETTLNVSSEEAGQDQFGDGFFNQAFARVLSCTENGLLLKRSGRVTQYGINRVGAFLPVVLPSDVPDHAAFLDFARQGDVSYGVGEQGLIVRNLTGQSIEVVPSGMTADLTGLCANDAQLAACSSKGDVLLSEDGLNWHPVLLADCKPLCAIAISERSVFVAVGSEGQMVTGYHEDAISFSAPVHSDLTDIAYGRGTFVAIGKQGTLLASKNGLVWQVIEAKTQDDWQAIDFRDGRFVVVGHFGSILYSDDGLLFHALEPLPDVNGIDVVLLSRQQYLILDEKGSFIISNDEGQTWQTSFSKTKMLSKVIDLAGKDKILSADDQGGLGLAQLVAEIKLDNPLKNGQFQAGDILFLEKPVLDIPQSFWTLYGNGQMVRTHEDTAPNGGFSCLRLDAQETGEATILSQQIRPEQISELDHKEVLQVSIWMRQQNVRNRKVQIWLSGPFEPIGTTFSNVGTGWKKYTYALVVPAFSVYDQQEIRFNISIDSGSLWIDRVSLSRIDEPEESLSLWQQEQIQSVRPQVIRLDCLGIGNQTILSENWVWPINNDIPLIINGCANQRIASMHAALELTRSAGADPWLVIDSYAGEGEILNLIEYLSAPISEPYGKLRQEQGMVFPWVQEFQKIYIEICDRQSVFSSDRLRSEFVNFIIYTMSRSPYYRQIKGQLVFVDGMVYQDGLMLSRADFHASDLLATQAENPIQTSYLSVQTYLDQIPRNPEKPVSDFPELIRAAAFPETRIQPVRLADLVDLALFDLGSQSGLVNLAMPEKEASRLIEIWHGASAIVSHAVRGSSLNINQLTSDLSGGETLVRQDPEAVVRAYGFSNDEQIVLVLTNLGDEAATCQLISDLPLVSAEISKYDENGHFLGRQKLRRSSSKITILPGGVVKICKTKT